MEQALTPRVAVSAATLRRLPPVGAWALGFAPVALLAFEGGGYDTVVRSQAGIAVWWLLALGVLVGALRLSLPSRRALVAVALLTALGGWSWIEITSSQSSERTLGEVARIATYLGFFLLALLAVDRRQAANVVLGVASAIGLVAVLAVLSRLQPSLVGNNEAGSFLPIAQHRLNWPLNYWNGLAALCALGLPLLLALATAHRSTLVRGAAAGLVPVLALCIDFTISRGGIIAAAIAVIALLVLFPIRLGLLSTYAVTGVASAILIAAAAQRDLLSRDLTSGAGLHQGDELTTVLIVVALGAALVQVGVTVLVSLREPRPARFTARQTGIVAAGAAVVAVAVAVAAGAPGALSDAWKEFKSPAAQASITANYDPSRLASLSSNGRYQLWKVAADSMDAHAGTGTGPGTFEFTWLRRTPIGATVQDAHSFYLQLGSEAGVPGLVLGAAFMLALLSAAWSLRRADWRRRITVAAAVAAICAFAFSSAVDWVWELPVVPVAVLLLTAAAFAPSPRTDGANRPVHRIAFGIAALVPIALLAVVLASASSIEESQADARTGLLPSALEHAIDAHAVDPGAATPLLQSAMVRELAHDFAGAVADARQAARREPANWRTWLVLSRLEARTGHPKAAVKAFRRARRLNPRSPLFRRP